MTDSMTSLSLLKRVRDQDQDAWRRFCVAEVGPDLDADFRNKLTLQNKLKDIGRS